MLISCEYISESYNKLYIHFITFFSEELLFSSYSCLKILIKQILIYSVFHHCTNSQVVHLILNL